MSRMCRRRWYDIEEDKVNGTFVLLLDMFLIP
jgi:hypothetical protein